MRPETPAETQSFDPIPGQMWQAPLLFVGVAAIIAAWLVRPLWHDPAARQFALDLAAIREALDVQTLDTGRALTVGEDLLVHVERHPDRAGEIHFLLGTAYLRRAQEGSRQQAAATLSKARQHLEDAVKLGVSDADRPALMYRLARVRYTIGADPAGVLEVLTQSANSAIENPFEHYEMLTQLHLKLPQPNLQAALEANAKLLALPIDNEDLLAPARLLRGELLLRGNQRDEARKVLSRIRQSSPAGIYARARLLRAQSSQQDRLWGEAAKLWDEMLKDSQHPVPDPGRTKYYLGLCYRHLNQPRDAARLWESTLAEDAESSQAAALAMAELVIIGPNPTQSLEWFERALREIRVPADYRNRLVDVAEVRRLVEAGTQSLIKVGEFARARRLTALYEPLARDVSRQLAGEVAQAWAVDCEQRAGQSSGATANRLNEEAVRHFREAADIYHSLAIAGHADQPRWLWQSADAYLRAKEYAQAADSLQRYLRVESDQEKLGHAWYTLADVFRSQRQDAAARSAYLKCIEYPGPYAFRARYQLATAEMAAARLENNPTKLDEAVRALEHNLELMRFAPDDEAYEQTLVALADLLLERGNVRLAVVRLQEFLNRFPGSPRQLAVRYQLAECFRRLAAQEEKVAQAATVLPHEPQNQLPQQRRRWLQSAVANYQKIIEDLSARAASGPLPTSDETTLRLALNAAAECHFDQGQFAEAISYYEELAVRYRNQPEVLKALKQAVRCYWILAGSSEEAQRPFFKNKALETIQRVRSVLKELPDSAFGDKPGLLVRQEEERWVEWAWRESR